MQKYYTNKLHTIQYSHKPSSQSQFLCAAATAASQTVQRAVLFTLNVNVLLRKGPKVLHWV